MESDVDSGNVNESWKTQTLAIGAVIGGLLGLGAAYLLVQNAEKRGSEKVEVTTGDGLRLSLLIMGVLRQIAALGEGEK